MSIECINNCVKIKEALNCAGIAWLHEACSELEEQTRRNTKDLSGKTKGSWQYKVDESKMEGHVGSNLENAISEEFGTGEYALNGNRGKAKRPFFKAYISLKAKLQKLAQERFKRLG